MGVRGLTTFISKDSEKYLLDHELHNIYLVIDGNNLAVQLYQWHTKCLDCFGGDYDQYAHIVRTFFDNFKRCAITPLVIFDGCYENKKLKTIYDRVFHRVAATKSLNASTEGSSRVFPLYLRELFTDLVISLGCKAFRCEFEADYEMACLAKTINAPILSYDSDFYIFDVLYVPFSMLDATPRMKRNAEGKVVHYLQCKLYRMDNFLNTFDGLEKSVMPLLATIVGNDYIAASVFKEFYSQLKIVKRKRVDSEQHRKIESVIKWLSNETYDSAARKILSRVKRDQRPKLAEQIEEVENGYNCVESSLLSHFGIELPKTIENPSSIVPPTKKHTSKIDLSTIPDTDASLYICEDNQQTSDEECVLEAPGELNLFTLHSHFPEWIIHQYSNCNFPAWFMDIAVHNRYIFIPQLENFDKAHSHVQSLKLVSAMHKILRSNHFDGNQLTYISREGKNFIQNHRLPQCELQLPTLSEIPGMSNTELIGHLHAALDINIGGNLSDFVNLFDNEWKLVILSILFWCNSCDEINKMHVYALILCGITLHTVGREIGYVRSIKDVNRKLKSSPQHQQQLHFMQQMIPYFCMDEKLSRNPRAYDIRIVDLFSRFQSVLFHVKYLNKLLLTPYDDFLISDFYNGTFIYNIYSVLKRRSDPLSYLKSLCSASAEIFGKFLQIGVEITCKLENIQEGNAKQRKRKHKQKKSDSASTNCEQKKTAISENASCSSDWDANNPYAVLNVE